MVACGRSFRTTCRISSADSTRVSSAAPGGVNAVGPLTSNTRAPRRSAASANAYPILPLDRLDRYRTGSIFSRVGPAVINTVSPTNSCDAPSASNVAATIASFSARRPGPVMPQARYPVPGSTILTPRFFRISRFACVAGLSHMLTFMAGATTTGAVVARNRVPRKSLAMPWANLARTSAVAGTTSSASIDCATAMCSTAESIFGCSAEPAPNMSVMTFSPESAAKVRGRINSWAARVMTTCTRTPRSCSSRTISAALYAAMPPLTPRAIFMIADGQFPIADGSIPKPSRQPANCPDLLLSQRLVEHFADDFDRRLGHFRDHPFHFAGLDFILRNSAGFAGVSFDDRRRTALQLSCAASGYQDVSIVAVEPFNQLHCFLPVASVRPRSLRSQTKLRSAASVPGCCSSGNLRPWPAFLHRQRIPESPSASAVPQAGSPSAL